MQRLGAGEGLSMSTKLKSLQDLRDQIKSGRVNPTKEEHKRQHFLDVNGEKVSITDERALEALEERIAALDVSES